MQLLSQERIQPRKGKNPRTKMGGSRLGCSPGLSTMRITRLRDPQCIKSCPTGTIGYKNAKKATYKKKKEAANKLGDLMGKLATL
jgi:hypothetical protein